jgi:predicted RNase H-like HicB family nuclease
VLRNRCTQASAHTGLASCRTHGAVTNGLGVRSRPGAAVQQSACGTSLQRYPSVVPEAHAMELALTAVFKKVPEGYIAFVEELPGANTQGETLEEARENLREAVELVLDANRALAREEAGEGEVIREPLKIAAG